MHAYRHRIRYHEVDTQGYLFNARYLEICDVAFTEFVRESGVEPAKQLSVFDPSVISAQIDFQRPTHFDDLLDVEVMCTHIGTSSFTLSYAISCDGSPRCTATLVYVNVDAAAEVSRPLGEQAVELLTKHLVSR